MTPGYRGAWASSVKSLVPLIAVTLLSACDASDLPGTRLSEVVPSGDPQHGITLIHSYGCGACHTIPGIQGASGLVGPPLYFFSRRTMIAGMLPNTPDNLVAWLENPQAVVPNNAMPYMGIDASDATDIAAYLYTIR
jgi:cytochrome c2